jgi:NAD(P)-dependent dehydrogenase (short-subunit alcohol dehydrogenase family)
LGLRGDGWLPGRERWEETVRANLTATFLTARAFLREVERNGHGSLVMISSTAGVFGEASRVPVPSGLENPVPPGA